MKRTNNNENNEDGIFAFDPFRVCKKTLNLQFSIHFWNIFIRRSSQTERERDAREEEEEEGDKRETL